MPDIPLRTHPCPDRFTAGHADCTICDAYAASWSPRPMPRAMRPPHPCPDRLERGHADCPACDAWAVTVYGPGAVAAYLGRAPLVADSALAASRSMPREQRPPHPCPDRLERGHSDCPACDTWAVTVHGYAAVTAYLRRAPLTA